MKRPNRNTRNRVKELLQLLKNIPNAVKSSPVNASCGIVAIIVSFTVVGLYFIKFGDGVIDSESFMGVLTISFFASLFLFLLSQAMIHNK